MQEVMCHIIADVAKNPSAKDGCCGIPIPIEHSVRELPKWCRKDEEQGRGHDKAKFVHRKIVVDAVEYEVSSNTDTIIWKVSLHHCQ